MMRITGGRHRGRAVEAPAHLSTRPTQSKLRQALFNTLQAEIPGARVLDLFAGSGILSFEALSREAVHAVCVERARDAAKVIEENAAELGLESQITLITGAVERSVDQMVRGGPFDVVLADPPYGQDWERRLLSELPWDKLLVPGGFFCVEWGIQGSGKKNFDQVLAAEWPFLVKIREKLYGESVLTSFQRTSLEKP
jgi:16S rRNA (guanine966-N2)-methyltransferase